MSSLNLMRSLALANVHERLKKQRETLKAGADNDTTTGMISGLRIAMEIVEEEADRIPSLPVSKPYKAPQMALCIDVDGNETIEEIR